MKTRKDRVLRHRPAAAERFNEAAPVKTRKASAPVLLGDLVDRFNEAAPVKTRKAVQPTDDDEPDDASTRPRR